MTTLPDLSADRIAAARAEIDPVFLNSPLIAAPELDRSLGLTLLVKDETRNPIRCFKGRGTSFYLARDDGSGGIVAASAGNFGQGLAYGATRRGRSLTVFASEGANAAKVEAMRRLGAEVVLGGADFDVAKARARAFAEERGLAFVEDGADAAIAEGAGTIAAELTDATPGLDAVFVPLGNGALAAGIGCWFKRHSPATRVIAVVAAGAPCMALSWQSGAVVSTERADTIADGIAVRVPVPQAVEWLKGTIDDVCLVDDAAILDAMRLARAAWGQPIEPAGAAGLAAVVARRDAFAGGRVATMLCGANLTPAQIAAWFGDKG